MKKVQCIGLAVHADTSAVAVAEPGGTVRTVGVIPTRPESIRRLVKQLGSPEPRRACYEAGQTGSVIDWQLTALGVTCEVGAPTLVPVKAGDRVQTGSARRPEAGTELPRRCLDAGVGARRRARSAARRGACPRGGEERSVARAPSGREVSAAARAAPTHRDESLDPTTSPVGEARAVCPGGARGDAPGRSPRGRASG